MIWVVMLKAKNHSPRKTTVSLSTDKLKGTPSGVSARSYTEGTFNLSKKIVESDAEDYIDVKDVKEFIKRLKESLLKDLEIPYDSSDYLCDVIDKLAGDELR